MTLKEKLAKVMEQCSHISRDAYNPEVGYPYVTAAKLNDCVNRALTANGIVTTAESRVEEIRTVGDKILATVTVAITLHDTESEETLMIKGLGSGIDNGDKSIAKAQTMATKYAWKGSLLIADSADDPDAVGGKVEPLKRSAPVKPATGNSGGFFAAIKG